MAKRTGSSSRKAAATVAKPVVAAAAVDDPIAAVEATLARMETATGAGVTHPPEATLVWYCSDCGYPNAGERARCEVCNEPWGSSLRMLEELSLRKYAAGLNTKLEKATSENSKAHIVDFKEQIRQLVRATKGAYKQDMYGYAVSMANGGQPERLVKATASAPQQPVSAPGGPARLSPSSHVQEEAGGAGDLRDAYRTHEPWPLKSASAATASTASTASASTTTAPMPRGGQPGRTAHPAPPARAANRDVAHGNTCPCCGNPTTSSKAVFLQGHDGRVHGWFVKVDTGAMKLQDLPPLVQQIYKVWTASESHSVRDAALAAMGRKG